MARTRQVNQEKEKATAEKTVETAKNVAPLKFNKGQLLRSKKYENRRDALNALLQDDKKYSFEQVDGILEKFYKGGHK